MITIYDWKHLNSLNSLMTSMLIEHILSKCKMPSSTGTTVSLSQTTIIAAQTTINTNDLKAKHVMYIAWRCDVHCSTPEKGSFCKHASLSKACKHQNITLNTHETQRDIQVWATGMSPFFLSSTRKSQPVSFDFTEKFQFETTRNWKSCKSLVPTNHHRQEKTLVGDIGMCSKPIALPPIITWNYATFVH